MSRLDRLAVVLLAFPGILAALRIAVIASHGSPVYARLLQHIVEGR